MKLAAIIPVFEPEPGDLKKLVSCVNHQLERIFIFENTTLDAETRRSLQRFPNVSLLGEKEPCNQGLARAYNQAALDAWRWGQEAVLLLDQDSEPAEDMIPQLVCSLDQLLARGQKVAAVGPMVIDKHRRRERPFLKLSSTGFRPVYITTREPFVACDFLISAGSVVPRTAWETVGPMDESFFVDHIDTEWCLRARSRGLQCFGDSKAVLRQQFGLPPKCGWISRRVPRYAPERLSYLVRNTADLCGRTDFPKSAKIHVAVRTMAICATGMLFGPRRLALLHRTWCGLHKGMTQRRPL